MKRRRERFMEYTLKGLGFFTIAITAIIIIILFV